MNVKKKEDRATAAGIAAILVEESETEGEGGGRSGGGLSPRQISEGTYT